MFISSKIGVIILAAGSSRRLGYPKQLVEFKAIPLLQHSINAAELIDFRTKILVLGAKAEEIEREINPGNFKVVNNENWEEGMASSIRKGLSESLNLDNELEHVLFLLSDQPLVTDKNIRDLIRVQLAGKNPATFSEYAGDVGVPAIFSKEVFVELGKLQGDQGAKKLFQDKNLKFKTVKFEKGNFDVDTNKDVEILKMMEKE